MTASWRVTTLQRKRETVLAMKRSNKTVAEIAAVVGMSAVWVTSTWGEMRRADPRAAAIESMQGGNSPRPQRVAEVRTAKKRIAPDWDFSGENLELPGGEGAR